MESFNGDAGLKSIDQIFFVDASIKISCEDKNIAASGTYLGREIFSISRRLVDVDDRETLLGCRATLEEHTLAIESEMLVSAGAEILKYLKVQRSWIIYKEVVVNTDGDKSGVRVVEMSGECVPIK